MFVEFSFPSLCSPGIFYSSSTLPTQRVSSPLSGGGGSGSGSPSKLQRLGSVSDTPAYSTTQRLPSSSSSSSSPSKQTPANRLAKSYRWRATVTVTLILILMCCCLYLMYNRVQWEGVAFERMSVFHTSVSFLVFRDSMRGGINNYNTLKWKGEIAFGVHLELQYMQA